MTYWDYTTPELPSNTKPGTTPILHVDYYTYYPQIATLTTPGTTPKIALELRSNTTPTIHLNIE